MDRGQNKTVVMVGALLAGALLFGAFVAVWLVSQAGNSVGVAATAKTVKDVKDVNVAQTGSVSSVPVSEQARITVHGTGIALAQPDILNLQAGVQTQNASLADAQWDVGQKINAMRQILKDGGVDDKDIATSSYSAESVMEYPQNQPPRRVGFRVTHILNIKIRNIEKAGNLIDKLVASGATTIYGMSFGFSDPTGPLKQARDAAMNDAWAKGQQYAKLGGVTLGLPLLIDDTGQNTPPAPTQKSPGFLDSGAPSGNTAISPGTQEVRVEVNVVYSIK